MKSLISTICLILSLAWCHTSLQAQTTSHGSSANEYLQEPQATADGGLLMGGYSIGGDRSGVLTRLDAAGNLLWTKDYAKLGRDIVLQSVEELPSGEILLAFNITRSNDKRDFIVAKTDVAGNIIWSKSHSRPNHDTPAIHMTRLSNGNIAIAGYTTSRTVSNNSAYRDFMLTLLDANGNFLWSRTDGEAGSIQNDWFYKGMELADGNLLLLGASRSAAYAGSYHNGYLMKVNPNTGGIIWHKGYPNSRNTSFPDAVELPNGEIVIGGSAGTTYSSGYFQIYARVDANGNLLSSKYYDLGSSYNAGGRMAYDAAANRIFVAGTDNTSTLSARQNYWFELETDGTFVDGYLYDLPFEERSGFIRVDSDKVYLYSTSRSLPAATTTNNYDYMVHISERSNPLSDCNALQITPTVGNYSIGRPYSISLSSNTALVLASANEGFTVTDMTWASANACSVPCTAEILSPATAELTCDVTSVDLEAFGTGGNGVSYLWSNGVANALITVTQADTYTVTVTAGDGCEATATINVTENTTEPSVGIVPSAPAFTCDDTSISLAVNASGQGALDYLWSTGDAMTGITANAHGTYTVTVTDTTNGCEATTSITLGGIDLTDSDCDGVPDVCDLCPGGDDTVDNDGDGQPDCAFPPAYNDLPADWKCGNGNNQHKVLICHVPQGNPSNAQTLCVNYNSVPTHLAHGDYLGGCYQVSCGGASAKWMGDHSVTEAAIKVYPNPASGEVNIDIPHEHAGARTLSIHDNMGVLLHSQSIDNDEAHTIRLDLSNSRYAKGVYIISLRSDDSVSSQRLVITQ